MSNTLAAMRPELVAEWPEKNEKPLQTVRLGGDKEGKIYIFLLLPYEEVAPVSKYSKNDEKIEIFLCYHISLERRELHARSDSTHCFASNQIYRRSFER